MLLFYPPLNIFFLQKKNVMYANKCVCMLLMREGYSLHCSGAAIHWVCVGNGPIIPIQLKGYT